jgi:pimeloyl-ACP methyl ester carboxylesterase
VLQCEANSLFCNRLCNDIDAWDPAFLDAVVNQGFKVIIFDYNGLGLSTGERTHNPLTLARDVIDLLDALDLLQVVLGEWSVGGLVA